MTQQNISPYLAEKNYSVSNNFQIPKQNISKTSNWQYSSGENKRADFNIDYNLAKRGNSNHVLQHKFQHDQLPYAKTETAINSELEEVFINDGKYYLGAAKAQLHNTYIISQSKDSVVITDQHAAHERLGYEKIKEQIKEKGILRQRLLIPEIIELSSKEKAEIIDENKKSLFDFGLSIEKFGEKSIIVSEIPSLLGDVNVIKLINDLSDHLT
jgi:DNA mismatch repair protein MutL